jgi:Flp pilus assembly protein TadD
VKEKGFSTAYNNLGNVYEQLGDKVKAKENYLKALESDPNNQNAKDNLIKLQ